MENEGVLLGTADEVGPSEGSKVVVGAWLGAVVGSVRRLPASKLGS